MLEDSKVTAKKHLAVANESLRILRKFQYDLNKELKDKKEAMEIDNRAHGLLEHSIGVQRQGREGIGNYR